ncbi:BED-type domain-containing protein [Citrus sinensis]|uniref:BED-type domain-containing protein n=1 Tax=Citrus sinensis TaxID=2711 RepID=A0ACB8JF45_CITSI|nr:BED-type domain-containing protein [Citrus sinensis]
MASPPVVNNESLDNDDVHVVEENAKDNDLTSRLRSVVWKHFERKIKNGKIRAFCKHYSKDYVGGPRDGTRHLNDHMKICPRRKQIEITHYSKKLKTVEDDQGNVKVETYSFDPDVTRGLIACMIIMHEYSLSCVEHEWFRKVLSSLNPMWKNVSRNTIKSDIMELYEMEKAKVVSLIESNRSKVAITTDMWTCGSQTKGYMAITTHFIDDSLTLRNQILRFIHVQARHTSQVLCDVLLRCLMDLNLERKLSALTVDNCTTDDRMIQLLLDKLDKNDLLMGGKLFHMRCTAHILNLIVKEGLSVISEGVAKIHASVAFWIVTPQRREKFKEISRRLNIPCSKELVLDCITRWNSTFLMISVALEYKNVFYRLHQLEAQYRCLPSESEWELARILSNNLKLSTPHPFFFFHSYFGGIDVRSKLVECLHKR